MCFTYMLSNGNRNFKKDISKYKRNQMNAWMWLVLWMISPLAFSSLLSCKIHRRGRPQSAKPKSAVPQWKKHIHRPPIVLLSDLPGAQASSKRKRQLRLLFNIYTSQHIYYYYLSSYMCILIKIKKVHWHSTTLRKYPLMKIIIISIRKLQWDVDRKTSHSQMTRFHWLSESYIDWLNEGWWTAVHEMHDCANYWICCCYPSQSVTYLDLSLVCFCPLSKLFHQIRNRNVIDYAVTC